MTDEEKVESQDEVQASNEDQASNNEDAAVEVDEAQPESVEPADEADSPGPSEDGETPENESADDGSKVVNDQDVHEDDAEAAMLAMLEDLPSEGEGATPEDIDFGSGEVSKVKFQHLSEPAAQSKPSNIDLLMDVNLPISIELGRTKMSITDILGLGQGSVVELNKLAGEPVDVLVNYKIVAKGEVVVIDENFGVRITQLMTPEERLKLLSEQE